MRNSYIDYTSHMPLITTKSYKLAVYEKGDPNSAICAIVLPGRLESKNYTHIESHMETLATLGFHAVAFDPPGSWESPGAIEMYTVTNYLNAVNELIEYYGNRPTILVGHSLGGSITILAGARNSHVIAYVALMSLVNNNSEAREDPEWKREGTVTFLRDLPPGDHHTTEQKRYDLPYSFFEDALTYDTNSALQTCHKPKLFILGKHDMQNASSYPLAEYAHIAEPKQLVELDSPHSYRYHKDIIAEVNVHIKHFVLSLPPLDTQTSSPWGVETK